MCKEMKRSGRQYPRVLSTAGRISDNSEPSSPSEINKRVETAKDKRSKVQKYSLQNFMFALAEHIVNGFTLLIGTN